MEEESVSPFFSRILAIMKKYEISTLNEFAIKHLGYKSQEKLNRLKKGKNSPSAEILIDLVKKWPDLNGNWLLTGEGNMLSGGSNMIEASRRAPEMADVLMVIAEGYKAQVETVKSIESKMAQETTQAKIEKKLTITLETLRTVAVRQEADEKVILESLARIEGASGKKLFQEVGKQKNQIEKLAAEFDSETD